MNRVIPDSSTRRSIDQTSPVRTREQGAVIESEVQKPSALSNFERYESMQGSGHKEVPRGILYTNNQTQEKDTNRIPVRLEHNERGRTGRLVAGLHPLPKRDLESPSTAGLTTDQCWSCESDQTSNIESNKVLCSLVPRRSSRRLSNQNDAREIVKTQECGRGHLSRRATERNPLDAADEESMSGHPRPERERDRLNQLQSSDHIGLEEILAGSVTRSQASPSSEQGLDSMLRGFLSRSQARKAAIGSTVSSQPFEARRRSPRRVLGRLDNNSPCSTRSQPPSTPSNCSKLDVAEDLDENRDESNPPSSRRRSSRKRFPAPPKSYTTIPSFIPVRRPDGVDPVKLQKSEAQELAIITRTNTRRNKGHSKFPRIRLETIGSNDPSADAITVPEKQTKRAKTVNWHDDNLVRYYAQVHDLGQELDLKGGKKEEATGSGIRRVRTLEAVNGTPKSKKLTRDPTLTHNTPRPRRRGKS